MSQRRRRHNHAPSTNAMLRSNSTRTRRRHAAPLLAASKIGAAFSVQFSPQPSQASRGYGFEPNKTSVVSSICHSLAAAVWARARSQRAHAVAHLERKFSAHRLAARAAWASCCEPETSVSRHGQAGTLVIHGARPIDAASHAATCACVELTWCCRSHAAARRVGRTAAPVGSGSGVTLRSHRHNKRRPQLV